MSAVTEQGVSTAAAPVAGASPVSKAARWGGGVATTLVGLFLLADGALRLVRFGPYVEGTVQSGYPEHLASPIGLALVIATVLYLVPRTAVLGAILITGYLGGAVATQVRIDPAWFLFPVAFGVLAWLGLYLRDPRVRALLPLRGVRRQG